MCQFAGTAPYAIIQRGWESLWFFTLKSQKAVWCSGNRNESGTREAVHYVWICRKGLKHSWTPLREPAMFASLMAVAFMSIAVCPLIRLSISLLVSDSRSNRNESAVRRHQYHHKPQKCLIRFSEPDLSVDLWWWHQPPRGCFADHFVVKLGLLWQGYKSVLVRRGKLLVRTSKKKARIFGHRKGIMQSGVALVPSGLVTFFRY